MKQKLVCVRWEDASQTQGPIPGGSKTTPLILETVGFVVYRSKRMLRVGQQWCEEYDEFRHVTNIPVKYITRIRKLTGNGKR